MAEASLEDRSVRCLTLLLNYRKAELTAGCLRNLLDAAPESHVLVIDNGSGAAEEARLQEAAGGREGVELLLMGDNLGYCAAMNRGLQRAAELDAEYVLFLNNDVTVSAGFLDPMLATLDNDASLAGVAPTVLRPDGRVWSQGAEVAFAPNLTRLLEQGRQPAPTSAGPRAAGFLPGACVLYRRADLARVSGLDESYFMYFEDIALGAALRSTGQKLIWLPWVRVTHDAGSSSGGAVSPLRKYLMANNSIRYLRSHFSVRLLAAFCLFDCLGLPLAYVSGGWRLGWAKTVGILDGLRGHRASAADVGRWVTS